MRGDRPFQFMDLEHQDAVEIDLRRQVVGQHDPHAVQPVVEEIAGNADDGPIAARRPATLG